MDSINIREVGMYKNIILEKKGAIDIVTLNRPQSLNALNSEVLSELDSYASSVSKGTRIIILTGAGEKAFVAGADIKEISTLDKNSAKEFALKGQSVFRKFEKLPQVVIGAINGFALGGGLELALSCDFLFCAPNAKFGLPEVSLGLIPGFGGTQRLSRYIGLQKAREMVYSGKHYTAQEALSFGLVNHIFESNLVEETLKFSEMILTKSPLGIAHAKQALNNGFDVSLDEGLSIEAHEFASLFGSQDQIEGVTAFLEKRKPQF